MKPIIRIAQLLCLYVCGAVLTNAQAVDPPVQVFVTGGVTGGQVKFSTRQPEWQLHLLVKNQLGETLFDSGYQHFGALAWNLNDQQGKPLNGGLYRYTLSLQDSGGQQVHTHKGSLILEQGAERLWIATQDETAIGADIVGGALTVTREAGRTLAGFRTTEEKQPPRDISGRALMDEKGHQLTESAQLAKPEKARLSGTQNRIAKFDAGGVNLIDSTITEAGGNVGIGATAPASALTVSSNLMTLQAPPVNTLLHLGAADGVTPRLLFDAYGAGIAPVMLFRRARGTAAAPSAVISGDQIMHLASIGYGGSGYSTTSRVSLIGFAAENWTNTAQGAHAAVSTTPNGTTTLIERMRITSDGNVGLGTNAPQAKLHVVNGDLLAGASGQEWIFHTRSQAGSDFLHITDSVNGAFQFQRGLILNKSGNIGIGTSAPARKLNLLGNIFEDVTFRGTRIGTGSAVSAPTATDFGAYLVRLEGSGHDGAGYTGITAAVSFLSTQNFTPTAHGTQIRFDTTADDTTSPNTRMIIDHDGQVGIGTPAPTALLSVNGTANKTGGGSWAVFSDERLKDIKGRFTPGLGALMQLQPIRFEYKPDNALGLKGVGEEVGFSAQAVKQVLPEAVSRNQQGYLQLHSDPILWTMLNAIKEQQAQIETLQTENQRLHTRFRALEKRWRKKTGAARP